MLAALPEDRYDARDIFIDRRGYWALRGMPVGGFRGLSQIDVVLNALHGGVGEDGSVQRVLERAGVPYAGARALPSAVTLNKSRAREILQQAGIRMPRGMSFSSDNDLNTGEMARMVFERFAPPYVVKPSSEGASHGIRVAPSLIALPDVLGDVLDAFGAALVEEYIRGQEVSVGVIENFRDEDLYALPPAHVILPEGSQFMKLQHHEEGTLRHMVPSRFDHREKSLLTDIARRAPTALELSHFSRADIILTTHGAYLLEVNALPGLYPGSSFPHMLESVGSSVSEFLEHAIRLAMR